jgi:hypothetical protein
VRDVSWKPRAQCRRADSPARPDDFFPGVRDVKRAEVAKRTCGMCLVRAECLAYAMSFRPAEDFGIYGMTTAGEREKIRRARRMRAQGREAV